MGELLDILGLRVHYHNDQSEEGWTSLGTYNNSRVNICKRHGERENPDDKVLLVPSVTFDWSIMGRCDATRNNPALLRRLLVLFCFFFFTCSCSSYVGMIGGAQKLSIGNGCNHKGIIIHEIGKIPSKHSKQEALNWYTVSHITYQFVSMSKYVTFCYRDIECIFE